MGPALTANQASSQNRFRRRRRMKPPYLLFSAGLSLQLTRNFGLAAALRFRRQVEKTYEARQGLGIELT